MADPEDIRGWLRLSHAVTTSGRLLDGDPQRLAAIGVRHVINLALDEHPDALAGEAEKLTAAGVVYTHIPVPFDAPTEEHFEAFEAALGSAEGPVHVHCTANWRVSAFFYLRNRAAGMAEPEARALMNRLWEPATSKAPHADKWAAFVARGME